MSHLNLTSSSFEAALVAIQTAKTEKACGAALVAAAAMVQRAVLGGQSPSDLMEVLESAGATYPTGVEAVLDRAVDVHDLEDGGQLRLWLVPVALVSEVAFSGHISLGKTGMKKMVVESLLQGSLSLRKETSAPAGSGIQGWVQVLPGLYADEALQQADISELLMLPHRVRNVLRGSSKTLRFAAEATTPAPGVQMFYLPVISYAAPGVAPSVAKSSIPLATAISNWVKSSLPKEFADVTDVQVCTTTHGFSAAFDVGDRMKREISVKHMLASVIQNSAVAPNGMAGLIALYHPQGMAEQFIGVTLVSRLMQQTVGLLNVPVESEDGMEELAQVRQALHEAGVTRVTVSQAPVPTIVCQHCGYPQYLSFNPTHLAGAEDVCDPKSRLH